MFSKSFIIDAVPVAKGRPKFAKRGKFVSTYTPKKTVDYESIVKQSAHDAMGYQDPLETPIRLLVTFVMPIPASYSKKAKEACLNGSTSHTKTPDIDNLLKSLTDAMNGIVYVDDSQITSIQAMKTYGAHTCTKVFIREDI